MTGQDTPNDQAPVRLERNGDVLWIWIDREHRRNAINPAVLSGISEGLSRAAGDPSLRAVVLTGRGEKAFCAGADLGDGTGTFQAGAEEPTTDFGRLARVARQLAIPLIARVNGACVAGGMGLMALCDLAIAADHARFGLPEVTVGVFPMQVLVFLRRKILATHLNALCLTGALISADRAAEIGLINEVVPAAELDERITSLLTTLRAASPVAVKRGKQAICAMESMAFHDALAFAEAQIALAAQTADAAEGLRAFAEKRRPRWNGDNA